MNHVVRIGRVAAFPQHNELPAAGHKATDGRSNYTENQASTVFIAVKMSVVALLLFMSVVSSAFSANWYVRPGQAGSNNGSDWNNAWSLSSINWATVSAGDTVWVAGGTYTTGLNASKSGSSPSSMINIKRILSTDSAPTSAAGWSSSFDSQVVIAPSSGNGIAIAGNYINVDGRISSGIKVNVPNTTGTPNGITLWGAQNSTVANIECAGPGTSATFAGYVQGIGGGGNNCLLTNLYLHGFNQNIQLYSANSLIFDHCQITDNGGANSATYHPNLIEYNGSSGMIFRYCLFDNWTVEGFMLWSGTGTPSGSLTLYGNVFRNGSRVLWPSGTGGQNGGPVLLYNNTFINTPVTINEGNSVAFLAGTQARNNIYWNVSNPYGGSAISDRDYDFSSGSTAGANSISSGSNPFVNLSGGDYHLVSTVGAKYPKDKGIALSAPYNIDPDGKTRGLDGAWDIGAFEYGAGVASTNAVILVSPGSLDFGSVTVGATSDLTFTVQNTGGGTLSGTASVPVPFSIIAGGSYNLGANQSQSVTVRFSPTTVGSTNRTVTFTGGNGATANVTGVGAGVASTNAVIVVSPISLDFGSVTVGATNDLTFTVTNIGGGTLAGTASVPAGAFSITSGATYSLTNGQSSSVTVEFTPKVVGATNQTLTFTGGGGATAIVSGLQVAPPISGSLSFEAEAGSVTAPFIVTNGYIYQPVETGVTNGGRAVYNFTITNAGDYVIQAVVNAPNTAANSFFVNVDSEPQDPTMIWQIPVTTGFASLIVNWQGNGTWDNPEFVRKIFNLTIGSHQLIIRGREANTQLDRFSLVKLPPPPTNLLVP